ncbi:DcuS/MalK family sensor histidine kinase [Bacillus sp. FJAT-44742]|uniref:DcuS/MalK family sensor histidine kinase n=1 Tax=Bacillus sp. FJAT-44742 TaxID=2014005 RepID=UPI000C242D84|nr:DcuS/MalK family sensor histidine kinase [Bacillus sp. FJAT-44742]
MREILERVRKSIGLQAWMTILICIVLVVSLALTGVFAGNYTTHQTREHQADKVMSIARSVSWSEAVQESLHNEEADEHVQAYTRTVQEDTEVEYIVVMNMEGLRFSHPVQDRIGEYFVGNDESRAFTGESYTSIAEGTLGESLRAFVPVWSGDEQIGVVSVGILIDNIEEEVLESQSVVFFGTLMGLLVGLLGALALAQRVKQTMHGLEPQEIAQLVKERDAMLASVREGIIAVNDKGEVVVANEEAKEYFQRAGFMKDPIGEQIDTFLPELGMKNIIENEKGEYDREETLGNIDIIISRVPVITDKKIVGAVATFREKTELTTLIDQLTDAKTYAETLRVHTHEFMNRLHVMSAMVHTESYEELKEYIDQISKNYQKEIGSVSRLVKDPVLAGYILNKMSQLREEGVTVDLKGEYPLPDLKDSEQMDGLITIIGNLSENAYEAVKNQEEKKVTFTVNYEEGYFYFNVQDNGHGIDPSDKDYIFEKGRSGKGQNRGYGLYLTKRALDNLNGSVEVISEKEEGTTFTVKVPYKGEEV